jgi:hypothetical protein
MKQRVGDFMYVTWMRQELEYQLDLWKVADKLILNFVNNTGNFNVSFFS